MNYLFRICFFLCCFFSFVLADEIEKTAPLVDTEQNISSLVNGTVSAISGDYIESHQDLVVVGPEPLTVERYYSSSDYTFGTQWFGWRLNHHNYLGLNATTNADKKATMYHVSLCDRSASSATFSIPNKNQIVRKSRNLDYTRPHRNRRWTKSLCLFAE